MGKGSRAWWVYNLVYGTVLIALAVGTAALLLWLCPPQQSVSSSWHSWAIGFACIAGSFVAQLVARAACRVAGLSRDAREIRVLERVAAGEEGVPDPPPLCYSFQSPRKKRLQSWCAFPVVAMWLAGIAAGWHEPDWILFAVSCVGTPVFVWPGVGAWRERDRGDLEVDWRGLRDIFKGRTVPWTSVESGWIYQQRDVTGTVVSEQLRLYEAQERCVWAFSIEKLPPETRASLFAWLRARAGLREAVAPST